MEVNSAASVSPDPITFTVFCSQRSAWTSYWGPEIACTQEVAESFERIENTTELLPTLPATSEIFIETAATERFICNLFSTSTSTNSYEVVFHCVPKHRSIANVIGSVLRDIIDCATYNTSMVVSNVLRPVSELELLLPKVLYRFTEVFGSSSDDCQRVNQVINCHNLIANDSFYENVEDELQLRSLVEPIQCYVGIVLDSVELWRAQSVMDVELAATTSTLLSSTMSYSIKDDSYENIIMRNEFWCDWTFLCVILVISAGGLGNILVCLAVALDRKLQNVTNFFLFSLAIADLLVSLVVMPLGAIPLLKGEYLYCRTILKIHFNLKMRRV